MDDIKFLDWIYDRLVHVHNENEIYAYMHKFRELIDRLTLERLTKSSSGSDKPTA